MPQTRSIGRDVVGFLAWSHGWTWGFWALAAALGDNVWRPPAVYLFYLGGAGVLLGGVVMTARARGRRGLRNLAGRCLDPRRIAPVWWAVVLLLPPAATLAGAALAAQFGIAPRPLAPDPRLAEPAALAALSGFLLIIGPIPEEVGWRGFLLDRLLERLSPLAAGLLVALAWWSWHAPLGLLPGYFEPFGHPPNLWWQLASLLPISVIYAWVYLRTGCSVLAVIVLHWTGNLTGELLRPADGLQPVEVALWSVVAIGVTAFEGARFTRPQPRAAPCVRNEGGTG